MGQIEVLTWLVKQRTAGIEDYFEPKQIREALKSQGLTNGTLHHVSWNCCELEGSGYVEAVVKGDFYNSRRAYRIRKCVVQRLKVLLK